MEKHPAAEAGEYPGVYDNDGWWVYSWLPALQCLPLLQAGARGGQEVEAQEEELIFTAMFQQEQLHNKLQRGERFSQKELFNRMLH